MSFTIVGLCVLCIVMLAADKSFKLLNKYDDDDDDDVNVGLLQ